jgi:hypothetical protein
VLPRRQLTIPVEVVTGALLWFGETHGTEECPRFIGDVIEHLAVTARVQLALEIPRDLQPQLDGYVRSDGGAASRRALLEGEFWRWQDGRSSCAMVELLDRVRTSRAAIEIVGFDIESDDAVTAARDREIAMAEMVVRTHASDAVMVVLSGGIHARRVRGAPWDPDFAPAAMHVAARELPIVTFGVSASGGMHWGVVGELPSPRVGVHANATDDPGEPWTFGPSKDRGYDWIYRVGATVASAPARP